MSHGRRDLGGNVRRAAIREPRARPSKVSVGKEELVYDAKKLVYFWQLGEMETHTMK